MTSALFVDSYNCLLFSQCTAIFKMIKILVVLVICAKCAKGAPKPGFHWMKNLKLTATVSVGNVEQLQSFCQIFGGYFCLDLHMKA